MPESAPSQFYIDQYLPDELREKQLNHLPVGTTLTLIESDEKTATLSYVNQGTQKQETIKVSIDTFNKLSKERRIKAPLTHMRATKIYTKTTNLRKTDTEEIQESLYAEARKVLNLD